MAFAACFTFIMLSRIFSTTDDQLIVQSVAYMSLGNTHLILSYAAYTHHHPKQRPHSIRAAFMYSLFYGVVFIAAEILSKLKPRKLC